MRTLYQSPTLHVTTKLDQDGQFHVHSVVEDQPIVDKTTEVRNSRLVVPGRNDARVHPDGAKIIYWFQAHPVLWARHKRQYPGIHKALHSRDPVAREMAGAAIAKQHPEWVCCAPKEIRR